MLNNLLDPIERLVMVPSTPKQVLETVKLACFFHRGVGGGAPFPPPP